MDFYSFTYNYFLQLIKFAYISIPIFLKYFFLENSNLDTKSYKNDIVSSVFL